MAKLKNGTALSFGMMTSVIRVRKWRVKQAEKGGKNLAVWLDQETADMLDELRQALGLKNAGTVSQAIKALHQVTCHNKKATEPRAKDGSKLYKEICDRYVAGASVADMKTDLIKAVDLLSKDGYEPAKIKNMLNDAVLPTISGKTKWTVTEIKKLFRYM